MEFACRLLHAEKSVCIEKCQKTRNRHSLAELDCRPKQIWPRGAILHAGQVTQVADRGILSANRARGRGKPFTNKGTAANRGWAERSELGLEAYRQRWQGRMAVRMAAVEKRCQGAPVTGDGAAGDGRRQRWHWFEVATAQTKGFLSFWEFLTFDFGLSQI